MLSVPLTASTALNMVWTKKKTGVRQELNLQEESDTRMDNDNKID
jgi:hypothetical protein